MPPRGSFRKGCGCEVFSTRVNVFFLPYYKLRTIFCGYGMILKRENNFSDRLNDPVSKGEKSSYVYICNLSAKLPGSESEKNSYFRPLYV